MDIRTEILIKGGLCIIALAVVILRHVRPGRLKPRQAGQLLGLMAIVAVLAYTNFARFHGRGAIHHWEQLHYFLGSKYFPELRYDGLYAATLRAERELQLGRPLQSHSRDLRSNEVVPTASLYSHGREVKERFTAERWRDFVADTGYFLRSNAYDYITQIRKDHGYNPTPTWTFAARLFSRWPAASDRSLVGLAWLDPILLVGLAVMIFRTYGSRVGCLAMIIYGLGYPWRYDWVGGAFLRQDWLVAIGLAVCLIKRRQHTWAGALIAYAAMVRVFPAGFLFGAAILAVKGLTRRQSITWAWRLAAGFAIGLLVCALAGCLTGAGVEAWPQFFDNLHKHHGTWLTNNVGLKNLILYDAATMRRDDVDWNLAEPWMIWQTKMNIREATLRPLIVCAAGLFLVVLGAAAWRMEPDEATVLGIGVAFAAVALTCYYWVMLLLVPLGRGRWKPTAVWLALNIGLFGLHLATPAFEMIYGIMSWVLAGYLIGWAAPDALKTAAEVRGWLRDKRLARKSS